MKAIVNTAPGKLEWCDWPTPTPGSGQVRMRTRACGICATDLKMIAGWERTACPSIPGHEWSGCVDAVGPGVDPQLVGRPCVAENVLRDGGEVGFEHPGGYAEFLLTDAANVQVLPDGFAPAEAALIEPLAVSVRALRRLRVVDTSAALIFGDGPIGLLLVNLLRRAGVGELVLVGGRPGRLALAQRLGATRVLNYRELAAGAAADGPYKLAPGGQGALYAGRNGSTRPGDALGDALRAACGRTFPNLVEAAGSADAADACVALAAPGAHVLVVGDYEQARASFPWQRVLIGELELAGSNASAGAWPEAVRLAVEGAVPLGELVSARLRAERFAEGMELVRGRRPDIVKVVLEWR